MKKSMSLIVGALASVVIVFSNCGGNKDKEKETQTETTVTESPVKETPMTAFSNDKVGFTIMLPEGSKISSEDIGGNGVSSCDIKVGDKTIISLVKHLDNMFASSLDEAAKNISPDQTVKEKKAFGEDFLVVTNPNTDGNVTVQYFAKGPKDYLNISCTCAKDDEAMITKTVCTLKSK